jgi:hypothetical protein
MSNRESKTDPPNLTREVMFSLSYSSRIKKTAGLCVCVQVSITASLRRWNTYSNGMLIKHLVD